MSRNNTPEFLTAAWPSADLPDVPTSAAPWQRTSLMICFQVQVPVEEEMVMKKSSGRLKW